MSLGDDLPKPDPPDWFRSIARTACTVWMFFSVLYTGQISYEFVTNKVEPETFYLLVMSLLWAILCWLMSSRSKS